MLCMHYIKKDWFGPVHNRSLISISMVRTETASWPTSAGPRPRSGPKCDQSGPVLSLSSVLGLDLKTLFCNVFCIQVPVVDPINDMSFAFVPPVHYLLWRESCFVNKLCQDVLEIIVAFIEDAVDCGSPMTSGVTHQMCLVLWTWRKLADETNVKNAPKIC